jgi:hypothetical protein
LAQVDVEAVVGHNETDPTTGFTVTIPAEATTGRYLVLQVESRNHLSGTGDPTVVDDDTGGNSWVKIGEASTNLKLTLWAKVATSGTAGKTITVGNLVNSSCGILTVYSGQYTSGGPITNFTGAQVAAGTETFAGFTPDHDDSRVVFVYGCHTNDTLIDSQATVNLGALTEHLETSSAGGNDCSTSVASKQQVGAAAATGDFSFAGADATYQYIIFAIRPEPDAGGTTYTQGVGGTLTSSADLSRRTDKALTATLSSSGAIARVTQKSLGGTLTSIGSLTKITSRALSGAVSLAGALLTGIRYTQAIAGALSFVGGLSGTNLGRVVVSHFVRYRRWRERRQFKGPFGR